MIALFKHGDPFILPGTDLGMGSVTQFWSMRHEGRAAGMTPGKQFQETLRSCVGGKSQACL